MKCLTNAFFLIFKLKLFLYFVYFFPYADKDIQDVVEVFSLTELDNLYPHLDHLSKVDCDNARLKSNDPRQKEKEVLHLWRDRNAHEATRAVLLEAMGKTKRFTAWTSALKQRWDRRPGKLKSKTIH